MHLFVYEQEATTTDSINGIKGVNGANGDNKDTEYLPKHPTQDPIFPPELQV